MNQEQNNLNPSNFNTQGNNGTHNNPSLNNQSFNSRPPKKVNLGLIIGIVAVVAIIIVAVLLFLSSNKNTNETPNNNSTNNTGSKANLTIDENISKKLDCLVTSDYMNKDYSYEIVLPNWNRYTFLKEYTKAGIDFDKQCDNDELIKTRLRTEDFIIYVSYDIDEYSVGMYSSLKESMTDSYWYKGIGEPEVNGNENGYWYTYMSSDVKNVYKEGNTNFLNVNIKKDLDLIPEIKMRYILNIDLEFVYNNEIGKERLNYILSDIKEIFTAKYNVDLSDLNVDMIKK